MKLIDNISYVLTVYLQINDHPKENNSDSSLSGINEIDEAAAAAEKCIIENILRADHADIIGKIKLEQEDKQDFYNTINKNGKQNLYHETIHENGIRFDIIEIEEECNISYEDERIEIEVDKKENTDRILSENVKEVLDIIEASMESGGAVSDYTMNTTSIYKKDAEAVISEAVKNAKNIEKDKNEIQAETTKEITNDRVLQHNYNRNKVYDEYDEILKQAIYAHERSKLQEHYEYLKACVSETKEEDQNQQYNNNMKHVSLFPESINSSPDNYNNGNLSKNINNIAVIDQHQYNKIEANKKNYSIRKNKTFKAAEGSSPFNNIISYKLLNKSLPKGHLAKEQQKKRRKEVLHNKKSRERQKQYFILKRKDA